MVVKGRRKPQKHSIAFVCTNEIATGNICVVKTEVDSHSPPILLFNTILEVLQSEAMSDKAEREQSAASKLMQKQEQERIRVLNKGVPLGFVEQSLSNNLTSRKLMRGLVFYTAFIVMFVYFFLARRDVEAEYFMANSLRDWLFGEELPPTSPLTPNMPNTLPYFEKTYDEIGNWGDWYDYVETVVAPQMFVDPPFNTLGRRLTGQNIPIGSLRIRSKHVRNDTCSVNGNFYPTNFTKTCYGAYSFKNEKRDPIGKDGYQWNFTDGCDGWPLMYIQGQYGRYDCSGYNVDIPFNTSFATALQTIADLRRGSFALIVSVRLLSIEFITYNPAIDAFTSAKMFVEVTEGGGYIPQQRFRPFRVQNGKDAGWGFYYIFFAFVVFIYTIGFIMDWRRHVRITHSHLSFIIDLWNFLEIINLASFYVVFGLVFFWWNTSVNIKFLHPTDFPLSLQSVGEVFFLQVYFNALNTVIVFLKIMKYLRLNNRLNILSRTMESAAQSIIGVLVIFCLVVTAYALAGYSLYGTALWDYRTVDFSFAGLFRLLVGQFDYEAMRSENRGLTFVYFWTFTILGLFVLLNFIVAVVMNGFDNETKRLKTLPLHVVLQQSWRNMKQFLTTPGLMGKVFGALLSSARPMPEKEVHEYVARHITTLKLTMETKADDGEGEEIQSMKVGEEMFYRHKWDDIVPRHVLEDIGEDYMNNMWVEIVTEYESLNEDEETRKRTALAHTIFNAVAEASTRVLLRHKKTLFGYIDPKKKKHTKINMERPTLTRKSTAALGLDKERQLSMSDWDAAADVLARRQIHLPGGYTASSTGQVVQDLESRVSRIEKRFSCMSQLIETIDEKFTQRMAKKTK